MEQALWIEWKKGKKQLASAGEKRVYFGHETCFFLLPSCSEAESLAAMIKERGTNATFVTPFLTENELPQVCRLIEGMLKILGELEVVCSDWGLLYYLSGHKVGTPVVGRLLAGQSADPRMMRILDSRLSSSQPRQIQHMDGTLCRLKKKHPSAALTRHYRSCWLDKPRVIDFLKSRGVHRCEISNVGQGIELTTVPGWRYSIWVPNIPITVMRRCPGEGENFNVIPGCPGKNCSEEIIPWYFPSFPAEIFRYGNGLYYNQPELPTNLDALPIDRIVRNEYGIC